MAWQELLLTIAEVSIAFAGFTGLIAVVAGRRSPEHSSEVFFRFRAMLDYSLGALLTALLPFLPHAAGLSETAVWQVSSGIFVLGNLGYYGLNLSVMRNWIRSSRGFREVWFIGEALILIGVAFNATGFFFDPSFLPYLVALFWSLLGAVVGFVQVVSLIWETSSQ